jgi:hypothetical protein
MTKKSETATDKTEDVVLLLEAQTPTYVDTGIASHVSVKISRRHVEHIAKLSALVKEHDLNSVDQFSGLATWIDFANAPIGHDLDNFDGKFIQSGSNRIGETTLEFAQRIAEELYGPNVSDLRARVDLQCMVVSAGEVVWTANDKGDDDQYRSETVNITDLCRRFGVDLPAHLVPSPSSSMRI